MPVLSTPVSFGPTVGTLGSCWLHLGSSRGTARFTLARRSFQLCLLWRAFRIHFRRRFPLALRISVSKICIKRGLFIIYTFGPCAFEASLLRTEVGNCRSIGATPPVPRRLYVTIRIGAKGKIDD